MFRSRPSLPGLDPIGANLRRIISLSVVIVRACGRSSKHGTSHLARLYPQSAVQGLLVPRLKRGMTTERFVARLKLAPMGLDLASRVFPTCGNLIVRTSGKPEVRCVTRQCIRLG
jgi:hypothetical protein